uniref:Neutral and basic amino acid transport protein rBAT-like n=1 Tax=Phallusia mammillata TaxID=59560 RepID=A0A6F9DS51_9ASCI|nr:neutral and basic amino acid transport protein rBAT-like [Phallusia mammillata]
MTPSTSDVTVEVNGNRMEMEPIHDGPYAGMPKEVLLKYSRQKKFVWARNILTACVILTILALLSMVIALIAVSPACQKFFQTSPIYQIYPKSFADSNNDGMGDINGIRSKLAYLGDDLNIETVWLNPVYDSPQIDNGYDVSDYRSIWPLFGTMADMEELITDLHDRGMKLIMDFVPNHTSDQHKWFNASSHPNHTDHEQYKDYYIWVDSTNGTSTGLPNNWQSVFPGNANSPAWEWNENREQFYYHAFYKEQPDLNLRNDQVLQELEDIMAYWMDMGVDGFRCDALAFMLESKSLRDNPLKDDTQPPSYENMYPDYTENQNGVHEIVASWRNLLKKYSSEPGVYRFMETEVYNEDIDIIMRYYGTEWQEEADFPMNFLLIDIGNDPSSWSGKNIEATVLKWMQNMPQSKWPNWVVGNHDNSRLVTRLGEKRARCTSFLTLTLSGTPGIYYGEEIGMTDYSMSDQTDFRDPERTPMQWDDTATAGFCYNCTPWLAVNPNNNDINVEAAKTEPTSMLSMYQDLLQLRSEVTFLRGWLCVVNSTQRSIVFVREMTGTQSYLVAINFDDGSSDTVDLTAFDTILPESGEIVAASDMTTSGNRQLRNLQIEAETGLVISFKRGGYFNQEASMSGRCFNPRKVCVNVIGLLEVC